MNFEELIKKYFFLFQKFALQPWQQQHESTKKSVYLFRSKQNHLPAFSSIAIVSSLELKTHQRERGKNFELLHIL